jgi:siroheme synthase (precorrin-2 oxidase/ferrochelatase)
MDDLVQLSEGLRAAALTVLSGPELLPLHDTVDAAIEQFRWNRRIAGDARKRNRILQAIYKGA